MAESKRGLRTKPEPGTVVRLTGYFLKATGQIAGGEGQKRWRVQECSCGLCTHGSQIFVAVDEEHEDPDPNMPRWRHIAGCNLQIVGAPPRVADQPEECRTGRAYMVKQP